ncbi:MAG: HAD-IA family hydrolase [Marinobacter sp.]|nr:HAD-IA family hydrolase [Marinobacter sp.]
MTSPLSVVLFDLDGTLLDTAPDFIRCLNLLRQQAGLARLDDALIRPSVSDGAQAMIRTCFGLTPDEPDYGPQLDRFLDLYEATVAECTRLYPGLDTIPELLARTGMPWGIVTNKPARFTHPLVRALALGAGAVICPDDVRNRKPDPEAIFLACEQLSVDPARGLYVGDHQRDIEAGRRAGMQTVAAAYGYINDADDVANWQADYVVETPAQLTSLLQSKLPLA